MILGSRFLPFLQILHQSVCSVQLFTYKSEKGCGGTLALTLTNGSGVTIGGASNNQVTVNKLVDIAKGNYVWDMQVTFSDTTVKTYLEGDFIVYDDVTKP